MSYTTTGCSSDHYLRLRFSDTMFLFQQISALFLIAANYCNADFQSDCSALSDSYYENGICYVVEQFNDQISLSSSCQSLNTDGSLIDLHTSDVMANVSTQLYNLTKSVSGFIPEITLNQLKIGDEIRIVGRILPGTEYAEIYWRNSSSDYMLIFKLHVDVHQIYCIAKVGNDLVWYDTVTATTNTSLIVEGEFDIKMKITTDTFEFYFDDILVHTCAQYQSYQHITKMDGYASEIWDTDLIAVNGQFYLNQKYFWSGLSRRNGKWVWEKSGLTLKSGYPGWAIGHPTDEPNKKCALLDGVSGNLVTADCTQNAKAICQYYDIPVNKKHRFSPDVQDKKVSTGHILVEFPIISRPWCLLKCSKVPTCKSVSFNENTGHCELNDIYGGQDIIDALGYEICNKI